MHDYIIALHDVFGLDDYLPWYPLVGKWYPENNWADFREILLWTL
jgi:hypothetical protein